MNIKTDISWQTPLHNACKSYFFNGCDINIALRLISISMQKSCPGPYHVVLIGDRVTIKFDDPHEEIIWRLKW
jgi:hypothetical protein